MLTGGTFTYDDVFSINKIYVLHIGNLQTCYIHSIKRAHNGNKMSQI